MAESAIRSPHRNPNSRSSEIDNPMRRSFGGNPFAKPSISTKQKGFNNPVTPANSPSDFTRRSIPSSLRDHEDKENGREHYPKQARLRSPSVVKGTKNFMSPTISAASKITASPKKKILAEKNAPSDGKASVSFSDVLEFIDAPQPETDMDHVSSPLIEKAQSTHTSDSGFSPGAQPETDMDHVSAPLIEKAQSTPVNGSGVCPDGRVAEEDCVNLDWSSSGSIPDQDIEADPEARPYDPETNFTSPRPQFLRYRPNPRIEEYLSRERRGDCLEDSFTSESSSDAELTEETETQSEDSLRDSDDVLSAEMVNGEETETQSEDSLRDSEDVSSAEMVNGELMQDVVSCEMAREVSGKAMQAEEASGGEEVLRVFEPTKEAVKEKRVSKLHFLKRPKTVFFLLTLLLACLSVSVTDPPTLGLLLKDASYSNFHLPTELTEYDVKAHFDGLSQSFELWYGKSISYISEFLHLPTELTEYDVKAHFDGLSQSFELWYGKSISYFSELVAKAREPKLGSLKYINLTALYNDHISIREFQDNVLERVVEGEKGFCPQTELEENGEEALGRDKVEVPDVSAAEVHEESKFEVHNNDKGVEEHNNILETEKAEVPDVPAAEEHGESEFEVHDNVKGEEEHNILETEKTEVPAAEVHEEQEFEVQDNVKGVEEHNIIQIEVGFVPEAEAPETNNLEAEKFQESDDIAPLDMETNSESMETNSESNMEAPAELSDPLEKIESTEAEESSTDSSKLDTTPAEGTESSEALAVHWLKDELLNLKVLGIGILLLALLAATALFLHIKKQSKRALSSTPAPIPEDQVLAKKPKISPQSPPSVEHSVQESLSLSRYSPMEVDMVGESSSFPSGTSSFQKSSYYSEAQSQDRKGKKKYNKRESMASSSDDYSVGSISSYGSFTTYEKISAKRVNGEEITPVRRSSRIRKQVMSP